MATRMAPRLPPEILIRILGHLAAESPGWKTKRRYLHLRLVSPWFGSQFAKTMLRNCHLDITTSPTSESNHLLKLVQANAVLAGCVKKLFVSDVDAYKCYLESMPFTDEETGSPSEATGLEGIGDVAAQVHTQLASLTAACVSLQMLSIYNGFGHPSGAPYSIFSSKMDALRIITLYNRAVVNHYHAAVQALRSDIALVISPNLGDSSDDETPVEFASRLALEPNHPPVTLDALLIMDTPYDFLSPFLAQLPLRPRNLHLRVLSYEGLSEIVDVLIEGALLENMQSFSVQISPDAAIAANQADPRQHVLSELERLRASGSAGLSVHILK